MAQRSNADVAEVGCPDLNACVDGFDIPALCCGPGGMPGQIKYYPTISFKSKMLEGYFQPGAGSAETVSINH